MKRLPTTRSAGHRHLGEQLVGLRQRRAALPRGQDLQAARPGPGPGRAVLGLTLYSENTRRPYDNGQPDLRDVNLDSRDETLQRNADDSIHLYVGPAAPPGLESNWMKTVNQDGWFVIFRLYAPTEPFFDRSWALPDFELVAP